MFQENESLGARKENEAGHMSWIQDAACEK